MTNVIMSSLIFILDSVLQMYKISLVICENIFLYIYIYIHNQNRFFFAKLIGNTKKKKQIEIELCKYLFNYNLIYKTKLTNNKKKYCPDSCTNRYRQSAWRSNLDSPIHCSTIHSEMNVSIENKRSHYACIWIACGSIFLKRCLHRVSNTHRFGRWDDRRCRGAYLVRALAGWANDTKRKRPTI